MRIVARKHLVLLGSKDSEAAVALTRWEARVRSGSWKTLSEMMAGFPKAKSLGGDRMRFEIAGGAYRLVAAFDFEQQAAFIKFIGSHAEYDDVDATTVAQF